RTRRAPGFSFVVVITLAITIGATTAIFSVVNPCRLRAIPYPDPARLVIVYQGMPKAPLALIGFSAPDFAEFEKRAASFETVAAYGNTEDQLAGVGTPA